MGRILYALLGVLIAAIVIISWAVAPRDAFAVYYWAAVFWLCLLVFINWFLSVRIFSSAESRRPIFGILPIAGVTLVVGSVFSVTTMFLHVSGEKEFFSTTHVILQVIFVGGTAALILLFRVADKTALIARPFGIPDKQKIIRQLNLMRADSDDITIAVLEKLVDKIEYELPHDSKLMGNEEWRAFCIEVTSAAESQSITHDKASELDRMLMRI